jgi:hypothetical protein
MSAVVRRLFRAWFSYRSRACSPTTSTKLQLAWLALVDLVTIRGREKFTLSDQYDSLLKPRGTSALRFWEPNISSRAKCGSRVQNKSVPSNLAIVTFRTLRSPICSTERWTTRSNNSSFPELVSESSFRY